MSKAKYIKVSLCGKHYLLDLDLIDEINQNLYVDAHLDNDSWILGEVPIREQKIHIINTHKVFGLSGKCEANSFNSILSLKTIHGNFGLLVDEVIGIKDRNQFKLGESCKKLLEPYPLNHIYCASDFSMNILVEFDPEQLVQFLNSQNVFSVAS